MPNPSLQPTRYGLRPSHAAELKRWRRNCRPPTPHQKATHMYWRLAGALAFLPHLAAVILATSRRPGFDHSKQYLSELGERGSETAALMNYLGIVPTGLLIAVFGLGLLKTCRSERLVLAAGSLIVLHGVCRVTAGLFPCDLGCRPAAPSLSQSIHNASAAIGYLSLTAAVFFAGAWLVARRRGAALIAATYALGVCASAALLMLFINLGGHLGLYQRIALLALQLWVAVFALHFIIRQPGRPSDA